ncbi:MAG: AfsR/SARP family transcriptional regulator [Gemmatimonadales bacterium]
MLRLQTFGGVSLFRGDENLTGAVTQRRRLGILVLLAASGATGLSRDKLLALLWPESDADSARHVLNQLLYAQRRQVGDDGLFLGRKTLRLNPAVIGSDVDAFEGALEADDLDAAANLYRGPFLDGFFLKDAPEFERWADQQRGRLARRAVGAFTELAGRSADTGDHRSAADWWRRAVDVDPFDSQSALALVRALAAGGDRAGALVMARRHEELLRTELGVDPDADFIETVAKLR